MAPPEPQARSSQAGRLKSRKGTSQGGRSRRKGPRTSKPKKTDRPTSEGDLTAPAVVGIGASAGGISAITKFLEKVPSDAGLAFVVILHLDPSRESHLVEILGRTTPMPVVPVQDGVAVERNSVYVVVPDHSITVSEGLLHVRRGGAHPERHPIDVLLRSLAEEQRERAIAVILSGTGTNGTAGIRAIKDVGGMVMVQDPMTAEFDGMPRSAIESGMADFILPPETMPEVLLGYVRHPYVLEPEPAAVDGSEWRDLNEVLAVLRVRTGHEFHCYKKATVVRRIHRRMGLRRVDTLPDYIRFLRKHAEEVEALQRDLMITVSAFFRDPEAWDELDEAVLRPLVEACEPGDSIRVWIPACSTGEEAYSVAMLIAEHLAETRKPLELRVFGTDVVEGALHTARAGRYPAAIAEEIPPRRLERFFERDDHHYRVKDSLRELVIFAPHNLLSDPPFSRLDLICCRNLLIYLEPDVQRQVLAVLHYGLREGGHLLLGNSETVSGMEDLFRPVSKKWRIYRRVGPTRHDLVQFPAPSGRHALPIELQRLIQRPPRAPGRLPDIARQLLVDQYAPAAVLIDPRGRILYFQGETERFLAQPTGEPTRDLVALVPEALRAKLRAGIRSALERGAPESVGGIRFQRGEEPSRRVSLRLTPLKGAEEDERLLMVAFEDERPKTRVRDRKPREQVSEGLGLESELQEAKDELRSTIEALEASNEELKASNEEVTSMNEELQSANEELETSREELQSLNEELSTVNAQLQSNVEELERTTDDLSNLLASSEIATIFLDTELLIRRFTPPVTRLLNVRPADVGRPMRDLSAKLTGPDLLQDAEGVLRTLIPSENEVRSDEGRWFIRRTLPYRTQDNRIAGIVITFVDITQRKRSELELHEAKESAETAKAALETLNRTLEQRIEERTTLLRLLRDVATVANQAETIEEAIRFVLQRVCEHSEWRLGHAFRLSADGEELVPTGLWYVEDPGPRFEVFRQVTLQTRFSASQGFVGEAAKEGEAEWVQDVRKDPRWRRRAAGDFGLPSAIFFPVTVHGRVVAVLEFFSDRALTPENTFLEIMENVGIQLGHVIERKELERQIASVAEMERSGLGREIHDTLGQQISAIALLAQTLRQKLERLGATEATDATQLVQSAEEMKGQVRALIGGLTPLHMDEEGLIDALERLAEHLAEMHDVVCRFDYDDDVLVPSTSAIHIFRITQEAAHNAVKHGAATRVTIELRRETGRVVLRVRDNGSGLQGDPNESPGMGLRIMRHRAGLIGAQFRLESPEGEGVTITCALPNEIV